MKNILTTLLLSAGLLIATAGFSQRGHSYHSGHYKGGHGSSHKGGHYKNSSTNNHYRHHKH